MPDYTTVAVIAAGVYTVLIALIVTFMTAGKREDEARAQLVAVRAESRPRAHRAHGQPARF